MAQQEGRNFNEERALQLIQLVLWSLQNQEVPKLNDLETLNQILGKIITFDYQLTNIQRRSLGQEPITQLPDENFNEIESILPQAIQQLRQTGTIKESTQREVIRVLEQYQSDWGNGPENLDNVR